MARPPQATNAAAQQEEINRLTRELRVCHEFLDLILPILARGETVVFVPPHALSQSFGMAVPVMNPSPTRYSLMLDATTYLKWRQANGGVPHPPPGRGLQRLPIDPPILLSLPDGLDLLTADGETVPVQRPSPVVPNQPTPGS
jgi:hypothetical protein